jgi:hypothetical protein
MEEVQQQLPLGLSQSQIQQGPRERDEEVLSKIQTGKTVRAADLF